MNILMSSSGGIIRGINNWPEYGLAKELVRRGNDVTVMSSSSIMRRHEAKKEETIDGINVKRFNPILPSAFFFTARNNFDLIHMHHLGYMAPISSYAYLARKSRPTVFTVHGIYHDPYIVKDVDDPFRNPVSRNIQNRFPYTKPWKIFNWFAHVPLKSSRVTALTQWEKRELEKFGVNNTTVIPNGITLTEYKKRNTDFFKKMGIGGEVLIFVGQPTRRKGYEYLVRAMPSVLREFPEAHAVFVGYRQNTEVEKLAKTLGVEGSVKTIGYLPEEMKISAMQSADAFVMPTLYEGFGIVYLEAMASWTPVITTDVAGNKEIFRDRKTGLLVKPKSPKEIADAAIELFNHKTLRNKLTSNAAKEVKKYDWKNICDMYVKTYEGVMG